MQIHILELTFSRPMARQVARHNLALCMAAMEALRTSYLSAVAAGKLFEMALRKVEGLRREHVEEPAGAVGLGPGAGLGAEDGGGEGEVFPLHGDGLAVAEGEGAAVGEVPFHTVASSVAEAGQMMPEIQWGGWPEGYATETAGFVVDVWLPWMQGLGDQ